MTQTFRIAESYKVNNYFVIGDKTKVSEVTFWDTLKNKVKELTRKHPEKYDAVLQTAEDHLLKSKSGLSVSDTWFEIKNNDKK